MVFRDGHVLEFPDMEEFMVVRDPGATGSTVILRLKGPLTISTFALLQRELREASESDMVIDLTDVPYIDSAGLGMILSHWAHTHNHGNQLVLTGVSERVARMLEVSGVKTLLPTFKTAEEAATSFLATGRAHSAGW
jgi:anti-sigma B factor antagonist